MAGEQNIVEQFLSSILGSGEADAASMDPNEWTRRFNLRQQAAQQAAAQRATDSAARQQQATAQRDTSRQADPMYQARLTAAEQRTGQQPRPTVAPVGGVSADQRQMEDIYNTMGAEGLQRIIASNPVQFAKENASGAVRISPNRVVDLKSGNITQQGDPVPRPQTLTELINIVNRIKDPVYGMPREVGQPLLQSMVQRFQEDAGLSPQQASLQRLVDMPRRQQAFDAAQTGKQGTLLPPDLVGAIGTPDFHQRLQDSAGRLDSKSLNTLMNLDRQERQFQMKSGASATKKSATYEKLRQMSALGIPITEDVIMGVTNPGIARSKSYQEALAARNTASGNPPRLFSLGQIAGIADPSQAAAQSPDQPAPVAAPEDRMRRLGSTLFGE